MRVALAQVRLDRPSRSATIQGIISVLDKAADANPAPDLVVLPGGCDGGADGAARKSVLEAIAHLAREWGVYVAAGMHGGRDREACALLFDADGDTVACAEVSNISASGCDAPSVAVHDSPFGAIGVVEATSIGYGQACASTAGRDVVMAVPIPGGGGERSATACANVESFLLPKPVATRVYWAVVLPAERDPGSSRAPGSPLPGSVVWAPDGRSLVKADSSEETIVCVDVPIVPKDIG